jgi:hypothetical protein
MKRSSASLGILSERRFGLEKRFPLPAVENNNGGLGEKVWFGVQ